MLRHRLRLFPRVHSLVGCVLVSLAISRIGAQDGEAVVVKSPNGQVEFGVFTNQPQLGFEIVFAGKQVIERSTLRILVDDAVLSENVEITGIERTQRDETYPTRGVHSVATNSFRGAIFELNGRGSETGFKLEVRAFNDGAAFRHEVSGSGKRIPDEATVFRIPEGSVVWHHDLGGHYEDVHERAEVEQIKSGQWIAPPMTYKLPGNGGYASITEAALENYSGMALQADGERGFALMLGHKHPISYPFRLRYSNDVERVSRPAVVDGEIRSPWRVVMVGRDLNALVNSDLVSNVCPAPNKEYFPKGTETDWVKPGRAVWKYLDGGANTFEQMKEFSRWAGELGFEYHVIEGFWSRWSDEQISELVKYSGERGVGLWLWRHSRELRTAETQRAFFSRLHRLGVVGAKIDFFDHEHKEVVDLYTQLLEEAAKEKILVNFHGSNKPTGEWRTWPNELIREGVRGMEASRLRERAGHNVTLPFTRYLAGHGDYTPVHFGARRGDTTWAHQAATAAVFTEPLLTYGAHPTNILQNASLEMIKLIPAVWDETRVLPVSEIGEVAGLVRRSGDEWFLVLLNGPSAREVPVELSFLPEGIYDALVVSDDEDDPAAVKVQRTRTTRANKMNIPLRSGGGYIARFARTSENQRER